MFAHNHTARANRHARIVQFVALAILALLFAPILGAAIVADLHNGGAALAFGPLSLIGGRMVCTGPLLKADDPGAGGGGKLTEEEFRAKMLGFADEIGKKSKATETELADVKEFRQKAEALFSDRDKAREDIDTLTKKLVTLERTANALRAARDPNEDPRDYLKRAFPDECKDLAEAFRSKANAYVVQRSETSASTAAASASVTFDSSIYSLVTQNGAFRRLDAHPVPAGTETMIVETSEPDFVFVAENGDIPDSALGLTTVGATPKTIGGFLGVPLEAIQDTSYDLGAYVALKFARAAARRADYVAFLGTGTNDANNGGFSGIATASTNVTQTAAGHTKLVNCTYDEIAAWVYSIGQAALENNPYVFMNPVMLAKFMGVKDGNGRPIFLTALEAPAYGAIGTLMGLPVQPVSVMSAIEVAGGPIAIVGDPMAYSVGIRKDYTFDFSDHYLFKSRQRAFRGYMRGAWKIKAPNNLAVLKLAAA